jgi:hypothetical protein
MALDVQYLDVEYEPEKRTLSQELERQLRRTVRIGGNAVTNTGVAVGDALNTGINMAGKPFGMKPLQLPSKMRDRFYEQIGIPKDEGFMEKATSFLGEAGGGMKLDPVLGAVTSRVNELVPQGFQTPQATAHNQTTRELHDAGYKLLPTQMQGRTATRSLEGSGGVDRTTTLLRDKNQSISQELAGRATNQRPGNITDEALSNYNQTIYRQTYEPVLNSLQNVPRGGRVQRQELQAILQRSQGNERLPQIQAQVVESFRNMTPREALEKIRQLRVDSKDAINRQERTYGYALRDIANSIEGQIERSLPQGSPLIETYRAGRTQIAKNEAVREMMVDRSTGIINPERAHQMREGGQILTDELATIANAGSPMYRASTSPPIKGAGSPVNWGDFWLGGAGAGLGLLASGSPMGLMGAAVPPVMRAASRHIIASQPVQNAMARKLVPTEPGPYAEALQNLPLSSIMPFFSQGQE